MKEKRWVQLPPDHEKKFLGLFTRDPDFYRTFFPLLIVMSLQSLATMAVNLADNFMLGTYSELALSGATLVNQIQFTLQRVVSGLGMGIVVLGSQYWGKGRTDPIKSIISLGVKCCLLVGALFFAVTLLLPEQALRLFTSDVAVIAEGKQYLRLMCWTYLIFSVSTALTYSLQSVGTAIIGTVMSVSTIIINVCINYCLIYGNFGAPEMGIVGAAVATLFSRLVELFIILGYVLLLDKKLRLKLRDLLRLDLTYLRDYFRVATPMILTGALWGIAMAAQMAVLGHISAVVIAANSVANVIWQIFAVVGMACGNAASVTMGMTVGKGRMEQIKPYAKTMQAVFLLIGLVSGGGMLLLKEAIVGLYVLSPETEALTLQFLTILSVATVGTCYQYPIQSGIIAGGGLTKYAAWVDNLFMWLFTIPTAFLSAFVFQMHPAVTFCFLKADQLLKCIPNSIVCNRYRWVRVLTRDE